MFSPFTTQLLADELQVLLIAESVDSSRLLRHLLTTFGVGTQVVLETEAVAALPATGEFYKIVWLCFGDSFQATRFRPLVRVLQQRTDSVMVVFTASTPLKTAEPPFAQLLALTQAQKGFLQELRRDLPQAGVLIGLDVCGGGSGFLSTQLSTWQVMTKSLRSDSTVLDLGLPLFFLDPQDFAMAVVKQLLRPHSVVHYMFQGKAISAQQYLKKIQELGLAQLGKTIIAQAHPVTLDEAWSATPVVIPQDQPWDVVLTHFFANLGSQPSLTPTPTDSQLPQPSYSSPKITSPSRLAAKTISIPEVAPVRPPVPVPVPVATTGRGKKHEQPLRVSRSTPVPISTSNAANAVLVAKDVDIDQELSRLFAQKRSERNADRVVESAQVTEKVTHRLARRRRVFGVGMGVLGAALGLLSLAGAYSISSTLLQRSLLSYVLTTSSASTITPPSPWLTGVSRVVAAQNSGYRQLLDWEVFTQPGQSAQLVEQLAQFGAEYELSQQQAGKVVVGTLSGNPGDVAQTTQLLFGSAQRAFEHLTQAQVTLQAFQPDDLTPAQVATWEQFGARVVALRKSLVAIQQLQPLYATLFGVEGKRTYAILLQNNQELRPSGGYIQAVALVTFDKGVVIDTQVLNVYELDSRLTATITPSDDMVRLLNEKRMFLRDSNWDPDFPTSANLITTLLEKSYGKSVDGVVALNLLTVEEFLKELGPLDLPEFNEVITDRNLWERMEFHSEVQLVPDASRPDYSSVLLKKLLQKMSTAPEQKSLELLGVWHRGLQSHQVLWALSDPNENASLQALGWTGALLTPQCPAQLSEGVCMVDTVAQVETNIGVNKANYYVRRDTKHLVSISPNQVRHTRTVELTNTGRSNTWPQGSYKAYFRFYLPPASRIESVLINGAPIGSDALIQDIKHDKNMVGAVIEVPIQTQKSLTLTYYQAIVPSPLWSYTFFNQQQPGITDSLRELRIEHDAGLKPSVVAPQAQVLGTSLLFTPEANAHFFGGIQFKR